MATRVCSGCFGDYLDGNGDDHGGFIIVAAIGVLSVAAQWMLVSAAQF
jgi:hypothetical protein